MTEDDLNAISNTVTSKDPWTDMEVLYKTVLELVQVGIQELKKQASQIQASVAQASQNDAQVTSAQPLDVTLPTTGYSYLFQIPTPSIQVDAIWRAQFYGLGEININLSMLPARKLHFMHSMNTNEIQYR